MGVVQLMQPLLLIFLFRGVAGYVTSCEEVKSDLDNNATTAVVVMQENFTNREQLKKLILSSGDNGLIHSAFKAALDMFNDGLISKSDRSNTRQVIYYITNAYPKNNMNGLIQFKASHGVIIVNNFHQTGQVVRPGRKELASQGYYLSNIGYTKPLQAFCKANCFCKRENIARVRSDPAIKASGGCYHVAPVGVPFFRAKTTCANNRGILATIHDEEKARFVGKLVNNTDSQFVWIGYKKSDDGVWKWEDQRQCEETAKCAFLNTTNPDLLWSAGKCRRGFPYVCQYTPCSVGYKDC